MSKELRGMLRNVQAPSYLIANPFSKTGNEDLDGQLTREIFFQDFYVISYAGYARFAEICSVQQNPNQNAVFLTGYRGCGKTTFVHHIESVIAGDFSIPHLDSNMIDTLDSYQSKDSDDLAGETGFTFLKTLDLLKKTFQSQNNDCVFEDSIDEFNFYVDYMNSAMRSRSLYLNFEEKINDEAAPVQQKLCKQIKMTIKKEIASGRNQEVFKLLSTIYVELKDIFDESFETQGTYSMKNFFNMLGRDQIVGCRVFEAVEVDVDTALSDCKLDQLLCILLLFDIAILSITGTADKLYYLFDNIDVVYDTRLLDEFIVSFMLFIGNMTELLRELVNKKLLSRAFGLYTDFCFIFAMRETSSMVISDHFHDRLHLSTRHFDISADVDRGMIIDRKFDYLVKHQDEIGNNGLITSVSRMKALCQDFYIKKYIYALFNFDYKRGTTCISTICEEFSSAIGQYFKIMDRAKYYDKHGARGIVYRLIFEIFRKNNYFENLGLNIHNINTIGFTPARLILVYLYNMQYQSYSNFLENDAASIGVSQLRRAFDSIFSDNTEISDSTFLEALIGMYSLKKAKYWSHLVTFDSLKTVSQEALLGLLQAKDPTRFANVHDAKVRITPAGRAYVQFVCIHFEFFACRLNRKEPPLFCDENRMFNVKQNKYNFEIVIDAVFEEARLCCERLNRVVLDTYIGTLKYNKEDFLKSSFTMQNRKKGTSMLHGERIIHSHISYLDHYRLHIINRYYSDNPVNVNKRLVLCIERYVNLLKENQYYSGVSENLFDAYTNAIQEIRNTGYKTLSRSISRTGH